MWHERAKNIELRILMLFRNVTRADNKVEGNGIVEAEVLGGNLSFKRLFGDGFFDINHRYYHGKRLLYISVDIVIIYNGVCLLKLFSLT